MYIRTPRQVLKEIKTWRGVLKGHSQRNQLNMKKF